MVFDVVNPFTAKGFPIDEYWKSSGVRQNKIYKCPGGTYGSESVNVLYRTCSP